MIKIIEIENGKIRVDAPYNPDFVSRIKLAGGKWNASEKKWEIDSRMKEHVRAIMREVFGEDDLPQEKISVRVKLNGSLEEECGPIAIFGRVVASAWGRDSGAKIGEGVAFEEGRPTSGGSMKHWRTIIPAGSIFCIFDVPRQAVENKLGWLDTYGTYEIISGTVPLADLLAERKALLDRLAEINKILEKYFDGEGVEKQNKNAV